MDIPSINFHLSSTRYYQKKIVNLAFKKSVILENRRRFLQISVSVQSSHIWLIALVVGHVWLIHFQIFK